MSNDLTSDNPYLSRPKLGLVHGGANECTDLPDAVAGYVRASLADNTRRAYLSDLAHFESWGGSHSSVTPKLLRAYLAAHAGTPALQPLSGASPRYQRRTKHEGYPIQPAQSWFGRR